MDKFKNYLSKAAFSVILLLLPAFIHVGQAVGAPPERDVNVVNTPSTPVPVREVANPAIQPFQATGSWFAGNQESGATFQFITVPNGKRLVIEYATANGQFPDGTKMVALITTTVGGITAQHQLVMIEQGLVSGSLVFAAAQPMRLYADPGTQVSGIVSRGDYTGGGGAGMTISGYFVDLP